MARMSAMVTNERETLAEARLWQAVIVSTIQDWISGPRRVKREAEHYLFGEDSDFALVCQSAGMDFSRLRSRLSQLRSRRPGSNCPSTA